MKSQYDELNGLIDELEASFQPGLPLWGIFRIAVILAMALSVIYAVSRITGGAVV